MFERETMDVEGPGAFCGFQKNGGGATVGAASTGGARVDNPWKLGVVDDQPMAVTVDDQPGFGMAGSKDLVAPAGR